VPVPTASRRARRLSRAFTLWAVIALSACGPSATPTDPGPDAPGPTEPLPVPAQGTEASLDFGTWNLEWFGDARNGPSDEDLQLDHVAHVIAGLEVDLWSVQEVVDEDHFAALLEALPGYGGMLANDPRVENGPAFYNDFSGNEQKVGVVFRLGVVDVDAARVILTDFDDAFAGRPPVEFEVAATIGGQTTDLIVIVLHAKAGSDADDRARREAGAEALKDYLDSTRADERVMVIGDFNDDVDVSISAPLPSPYAGFVEAPADYTFPTGTLSAIGETSTTFFGDMIDHHLATDELQAGYVVGSVMVFGADDYIEDYAQTTSDHFPVLTRYTPGG